jgi:hypothetical protein
MALWRVPQALGGVPHLAVFMVRVLTFLRGIGDSNVPAAKPKNKKPASKFETGFSRNTGHVNQLAAAAAGA